MTKLRKVFVVIGHDDHECSNVLRVARKKRRAEAFQKRCQEHDAKEPRYPFANMRSDDIPDKPYEQWIAKRDAWEAKHPAKRKYDSYPLIAVGFDDAD